MSGSELPPEVMDVVEELKGRLVEGRGGRPRLPDISDKEFYTKLDAIVMVLENMGVNAPYKKIADALGVSYAHLRRMLSKWRQSRDEIRDTSRVAEEYSRIKESMDAGRELVEESVKITPPSPPGEERPPLVPPTEESMPKITRQVEKAIAATVIRTAARHAEEVAKEKTEVMLKIGGYVLDRYEKYCHRKGFDDMKACIDAVFGFYEKKDELEKIIDKYRETRELLKKLMIDVVRRDPRFWIDQLEKIVDKMVVAGCSEEDIEKVENILDKIYSAVENIM